MHTWRLWLAMPVALTIAVLVAAAVPPTDEDFVRIKPGQVRWMPMADAPGVLTAFLRGDPAKPGFYVMRVKFPPYVVDRPHWHPNDRYVTVLQGTWYTGTGALFDLRHAVPMPPGSFMFHPARAAHWDGSASNQTVIVQIEGMGPATTTPLDPRQPLWVRLPH